jgi:hypothetical protein
MVIQVLDELRGPYDVLETTTTIFVELDDLKDRSLIVTRPGDSQLYALYSRLCSSSSHYPMPLSHNMIQAEQPSLFLLNIIVPLQIMNSHLRRHDVMSQIIRMAFVYSNVPVSLLYYPLLRFHASTFLISERSMSCLLLHIRAEWLPILLFIA